MAQLFVLPTAQRPFEISWPVEVTVPQDGGTVSTEHFSVRFRLLPHSKVAEILGLDADPTAGDFSQTMARKTLDGPVSLLREVVVGVEGIADASGQPLDFSPEVRDQMIDMPFVRKALLTAYRRCADGASVKN